ncbi:MAG: hypothetical protein ACJ8C4_13870 [Gemmataceae bacterium]
MLTLPHRLRLARRIEAAWISRSSDDTARIRRALDTLDDHVRALRELGQRLIYAQGRGWYSVGADLQSNYDRQLESFNLCARRLVDEERWVPTQSRRLGEWLGEFEQLEEEFGQIKVDWNRRCLSIVTEPITLEEVDLGPFSIELFWERLAHRAGSSCFNIVALEPNPATCNESVTHPHVREGELCAGDATAPIEKALSEGRLADAALLVRSVLQCYNRHSPFVSLDQWSGTACHDCGAMEDPDELSYCEGCDGDFCQTCFTSCAACDRYRCTECLSRCDVCGAPHCDRCMGSSNLSDRPCCSDCLTPCLQCGELFATDELIADTQLCPDCDTEPTLSSDEEPISPSNEETHVTLQSVPPSAPTPPDPDLFPAGLVETPVLLSSG